MPATALAAEASLLCTWMFYIEAFEYRQHCGPPITDDQRKRYETARRLLETYIKDHDGAHNMDSFAQEAARARSEWDAAKRQCNDESYRHLHKLFDAMTSEE